jgi:CRISPR-associated protein Cas2
VSRNVFKICKKYLTNIQKSVFEGNLTELNYMRLKIKLNKYLRIDRDEKWLEKEFLGVMDDKTSNFFK